MESWRSRTELLVLQRERSTLPGKLEMLVWMLLASCREAEGAHSLPQGHKQCPTLPFSLKTFGPCKQSWRRGLEGF